MTVHCNLHPSRPAHFQCNVCGSAFCGACIVKRVLPDEYGGTSNQYLCPFCEVEADPLEVANLLDPFWTRMSKFFLYPAQKHPLAIALVLALLTAFFPLSRLVHLFCFVISTKYAYTVLINTAGGDLRAPEASFDLFTSDVGQVFKQYLVFIVVFFIGMQVFRFTGVIGGSLFALAAILLLPAMLMMLVSTNSVVAALNPMFVVPIVFRIGWSYLLMFLFLGLLPAGPAVLLHFLPESIPSGLTNFVATFLQHYYTFISYNLMGYVLLQYHEEIGYDVDYEHFIACSTPKDEQEAIDPKLARRHHIDTLIKSGRHEAALKIAGEEFQEDKEDIAISGKYFDLLKVCRKKEEYARHGPVHLQLLIDRKKPTKALRVYQELVSNAAIAIPIDSSLAVGKWLFDRNEFQKAGKCYLRCIKENPKHPKLPEAYFPFIRLLHEHFGKTEKALHLSEGVIRTWPDHPLSEEVKTYMRSMS